MNLDPEFDVSRTVITACCIILQSLPIEMPTSLIRNTTCLSARSAKPVMPFSIGITPHVRHVVPWRNASTFFSKPALFQGADCKALTALKAQTAAQQTIKYGP